jgi:hypothetical protein
MGRIDELLAKVDRLSNERREHEEEEHEKQRDREREMLRSLLGTRHYEDPPPLAQGDRIWRGVKVFVDESVGMPVLVKYVMAYTEPFGAWSEPSIGSRGDLVLKADHGFLHTSKWTVFGGKGKGIALFCKELPAAWTYLEVKRLHRKGVQVTSASVIPVCGDIEELAAVYDPKNQPYLLFTDGFGIDTDQGRLVIPRQGASDEDRGEGG